MDEALEAITGTVRSAIEQGEDIIVLHRFSSSCFDAGSGYAGPETPACDYWFGQVIDVCEAEGTAHYYGDHLEEFCAMIAPTLPGRAVSGAGLCGDEEGGCVAAVRRSLETRGVRTRGARRRGSDG